MYAKVAPSYRMPLELDVFDYLVPRELESVLKPGFFVMVPFRGRLIQGVVWELSGTPSIKSEKILSIHSAITRQELFDESDLKLLEYAAEYYLVSKGALVKAVIPDAPKRFREEPLNDSRGSQNIAAGFGPSPLLDRLAVKPALFLYQDKRRMLEEIRNWIADKFSAKNQFLILEPQIKSIEQTAAYLNESFPGAVASLHSGLSRGSYWKNWIDFACGKKSILVASRVGIFAPSANLTAIFVIDEEMPDFKQYDQNPRYDARSLALKVSESRKIPAVFCTGAPRLETWHAAKNQGWLVIEQKGKDSAVSTIDLKFERQTHNFSLLSDRLLQAGLGALQNHQKVLLFFNRRGWATSTICRDCGYAYLCPECQIPQIAHKNRLVCHHCGESRDIPLACDKCGGTNIKMVGAGTETLEREIKESFGNYRILRLDKDVDTPIRYNLDDYDVILGTNYLVKEYYGEILQQKIGVVGIINSDNLFNIPDFRSTERAWQEIRKIRNLAGALGAEIFIQTMRPDNKVLQSVDSPDNFFRDEIAARQSFNYPPFTKLIKLIIQNTNEELAQGLAQRIYAELGALVQKGAEILGPYPATPKKIRGQFRILITLKIPRDMDKNFLKTYANDIIIDVDPEFILS
ncbi:MAG: primosomal protein N' [Patescibacteria group bacterium]|nr:primosomal protein N' [Patescibacteria group bacterium]